MADNTSNATLANGSSNRPAGVPSLAETLDILKVHSGHPGWEIAEKPTVTPILAGASR